MRRSIPLFAVLLFLVFAGPSRIAPKFGLTGGPIILNAAPVVLDPRDPRRRRVGELTFLRGWDLTSTSEDLGGLSALRPWHGRWLAVQDTGALVDFSPARRDARIIPLAPRCNPHRLKLGRDTEGLDTDGTHIWVSAEWHNTICRLDPDGVQTGIQPPDMADWPRRSGPETLLRLRDGRFLVLPEDASFPALLFPGDPVSGVKPAKLRYRPPDGYWPTDAVELPDGRIIILNREFGLHGFAVKLVLFDRIPARGTQQGRTLATLATLAAPLTHDNFEGIAARREGSATILTIVSDNNYSWWQRTLLLEFQLDD
ncbi:hypothetical protein SPAN111604_05680 [Sphingomonas antarctica]|uniref:esterase-like activity of phytase family protein n=1 Tax=Sphingomonas antarctica TaxID=2040274 RepID=UPI0039E9B9A6